MHSNFTARISFDGKHELAVIIPTFRRDGMHYEVNIPGFPRFFMRWGTMDRYEAKNQQALKLPDSLVLAVSDAIEERKNN